MYCAKCKQSSCNCNYTICCFIIGILANGGILMSETITAMLYIGSQNSEISRSINSLIKQSYDDLEIIIIDDSGSSSQKIIDKETVTLRKISIIKHSKKIGLYRSIREQLNFVAGDYILILDDNVSLSLDLIRVLHKKIVETNSDVAVADVAKRDDKKMFYYNLDVLKTLELELGTTEVSCVTETQGFVYGIMSLYNKLFKKSILVKAFSTISEENETAVLYNAYAILKILGCAEKICNAHNVLTVYDDKFCPVDIGVKSKSEIQVFDRIKKEIMFNGKKKEIPSEFILSFFISFFFFHKCYYADKIKALIRDIFKLNASETNHTYNKMLRIFNLTTECSENFLAYENIKSFICDPKVKYFGFDIFDTLVIRPFFEPVDLFVLLNSKFNELFSEDACIDFSVIRKEGESACRQYYNVIRPCNEDVSLNEIYNFISEKYGIERNITDELLKYEEQLELSFIQPRMTGREFFELAKYKKKNIFIASDMYLSEEQINSMLSKCGYSDYKLYLSNKIGVSKYSGNLYKYIINDLNIDITNEKVGFMGDNYNVDVINSKNNGLIGFHIPKTIELMMNSNLMIYTGEFFKRMFTADGGIIDLNTVLKFHGIRSMLALVANKLFDNPYISINRTSDFNSSIRTIGYFVCGMFLYGEAKWVYDRAENENKRTVHFVSRDGYFIKKAFDIINTKKQGKVKSNYLYLSRKAIVPLYMQEGMSLLEAYLPPHAIRQSPESIIRTMRPILSEYVLSNVEELCKNHGFPYKKTFTNLHQYYSFAAFFASEIYRNEDYIKYVDMVKPYFANQILPNDVLFDIGYSGRCEKILTSLLGFPINSYYFHTHEPMALTRKKKMGFEIETFYSFKPASAFVTREQIFTPNAPSCVGFSVEHGKCTPSFDKKNKASFIGSYYISELQKFAIQFVDDFISVFGDYDEITTINCFDSCYPFEYYLHYAKDFDRQLFAFIDFEDDFGTNEVMHVKDYWDKESANYKCNMHFNNISSTNNIEKMLHPENMISIDEFNEGINKIYNSWTWRVGRFVMAIPSAIKKALGRRNK